MYTISNILNPTVEELSFLKKAAFDIMGVSPYPIFGNNHLVGTCYAVLYAKIDNPTDEEKSLFEEINSSSAVLARNLSAEAFDYVYDKYDDSVLKAIIVNYGRIIDGNEFVTPESLSDLAIRIMDIKPEEAVLDLCSGVGGFLTAAYTNNSDANYTGVDINSESALITKIISYVLKGAFTIENKNVFLLAEHDKKFDKIFANYPFGMRIRDLGTGNEYIDKISNKVTAISKATSSDWVFNYLALDLLENTGKAVCISTNGSMFNTIDKPIRKYFVDNGYIETVISLPGRLFYTTNIPVTMIVLSKGNNGIKFVDASAFYQKGRRNNTLSSEDINKILHGVKEKTEYSEFASKDQIVSEDYNLSPNRYLSSYIEKLAVKDGKPFSSVIKSITRGASIRADELDKLTVYEETDYQYLMLSNIQNGIIDTELPYLSNIEPALEKYCLKENNLILSKNGYPYKVAVVGKSDKKILANGNLFIIELDEEQVDPYYIKALFESEKGIALLKSITVGATIPNIGVSQLQNLVIPIPSMEEQKKIAAMFQEVEDEIKLLQLRIQKAIARKNQVFEEGMEE